MRTLRWLALLLLSGIAPYSGVAEIAPATASHPAIRRILLVPASRPDMPIAAGQPPVDLHGVPQLGRSTLAATLAGFIGRPLTATTLAEIPPLIVAALRSAGWPSVRVFIPETVQSPGIVRIVVTVYVVHAIHVDGASYLPPEFYASALGAHAGAPLDPARLQAGLRQINGSDLRSAELDLMPTDDPGAIDIVVHAHDRLPLRLEAGYANDGAPNTGRDQYHFSLTWNNVVGMLDDRMTYEFVTNNPRSRAPVQLGHSVDYEVRWGDAGTVSVLAGYAFARVPGYGGASATGATIQASPRFTRPLIDAHDMHLWLQIGYDFKSVDNDLLYGGSAATRSTGRISQFTLALLAARPDDWGVSDATFSLFASPGGMMVGNDDSSFRTLSSAARARYGYVRLDLTRSTTLPFGLDWVVHGSGQLAGTGLLPSEQINAGGPGSVRGYPAYALRGDAGVLLSNELRLPELRPLSPTGQTLDLRVTPYVFIDYGAVHARDKATALDGTLTSFGPGARIGLDRYVDLVLDLGVQLRVQSGRRYPGQFFDVAVTVRY